MFNRKESNLRVHLAVIIDKILNVIKYYDPDKLSVLIQISLGHLLIFIFTCDMLPYAFDF